MVKLNYGKYSIPAILDKIIGLQLQLQKAGLLESGDVLGYYFSYEGVDSRYLNTPLDVIAFARPGSDGIHFGFLTDFGQRKDLENTYIVRVSPMDFDDPVKIVARNIHDFLRILCFSPSVLDMVDFTTSERNLEKWVKECSQLSINQNKVRNMFCHTFQLTPIDSLYEYIQKVKQERDTEIVLSTEDGIGVASTNKNAINKQDLFQLDREQILEVKEVERFFRDSSYESKLAFLRDAQSKGLIFDNAEVKLYLKDQLRLIDLWDEAERISYPELVNY
ncbi:hypothetical protein J7E63_28150 [Bacillus sp. ISL-75]|uniref:hypothetical protein n=1 Tax=Bacillus sp. ISL-75 TaxID=2819137 RepID=UPI001BEC55DC|nr:hypothetical protein [Bacillus sp. ISL-75]MBT2730689.1 hypothetical protein [Bacillus sp. ISL-75]